MAGIVVAREGRRRLAVAVPGDRIGAPARVVSARWIDPAGRPANAGIRPEALQRARTRTRRAAVPDRRDRDVDLHRRAAVPRRSDQVLLQPGVLGEDDDAG